MKKQLTNENGEVREPTDSDVKRMPPTAKNLKRGRTVGIITTERTTISLITSSEGAQFRDYYLRNHQHLAPWEPPRPAEYHDREAWEKRAGQFAQDIAADRAYRFAARLHGDEKILAFVNFNNIVRGAFQACHLGYSIDIEGQGKSLMFEVLSSLIAHVFEEYELHRVMANYIPENIRSGRLLERLGFDMEGRARDYLFIGDGWKDHILTSLINKSFKFAG